MATFTLKLDSRITVEKDKHHLTVRVSDKKEILYLRIGVLMTKKEFDSIFAKKSFDPTIDEIKRKFQVYVDRAEKIFPLIQPFNSSKFREYYYDPKFDANSICTQDKIEGGSIKFMYENYVKIKIENSQIAKSTGDLYLYNMRVLNRFKADLNYQEITSEFLSSFENWFINQKRSTGELKSMATVGNICRSLRSILNYYKKKRIIPLTYEYPFLDYKVPNYTPPKMVISNEEIQTIIDCKEFNDIWEEYARDIWVMLYRMNGSNFIDLLKLKWSNIQGNHLVFIRHKKCGCFNS